MSTHQVLAFRVPSPRKHPNADSLEIFDVGGLTIVARIGAFAEGSLAALIEPDYIFKGERVRPARLRGVWSEGLLVPAPEGAIEGENLIEKLGITRYEPKTTTRLVTSAPDGLEVKPPKLSEASHKYDLEPWSRHRDLLSPGTPCVVTEKLHGANARYVWHDGRLHIGSRNRWLNPSADTVWHKYPSWLVDLCKQNPDCLFFGEIVGIQDLKYGFADGVGLYLFDALYADHFLSDLVLRCLVDPKYCTPVLYAGEYSEDIVRSLAEGPSTLASHVREGCVVSYSGYKFKHVGHGYYLRNTKRFTK